MGHIRKRRARPGWYGYFKAPDGKWREVRLPGTKPEAREALRKLEIEAWAARKQLDEPSPEVEIQQLKAAWRAHIVTHCRPRTWESYDLGLREVLPWLAARALKAGREKPASVRDIKLDDVRAFAAAKLDSGAAPRTVNMRVGALVAMLNWGLAEGWITQTPLARRKPLKAGPQRRHRRSLTEFEIAKLLGMSPAHLAEIWLLFLGTGLRAGELTALEWRDVDLERGELHIRPEVSKSRKHRVVPLRKDVAAALRRLRLHVWERPRTEAAARLVFVNSRGNPWRWNLSRRLKRCLKAAGLPESLDLHCLRHSFGSHLIRAGADVKTVQALLGHSSAMVTLDIYAHEFDDSKREAVELIPLAGLGERESRPAYIRPRAVGQE